MAYYPTVFGYGSGKADSFDVFVEVSKYDVRKSVFYGEETSELLNDCFYFILTRLRELFRDGGRCFEDLIFYPLAREVAWTPFRRALFYPGVDQSDREVVLTEKEVYTCRGGKWRGTNVMLVDQGRKLIGYVMKEMESCLRRTMKFKYKLTANVKVCDEKTLAAFAEVGIQLPELIQSAVAEFYRVLTHKEVNVDMSNLGRIRVEALATQEKLIVPEEEDIRVVEVEKPEPKAPVTTTFTADPWQLFKTSLTDIESDALQRLLAGDSVQSFAKEKMIMLEVLVDGINDKAMDHVGDAVLELEDDVVVYEEYIEELVAIL